MAPCGDLPAGPVSPFWPEKIETQSVQFMNKKKNCYTIEIDLADIWAMATELFGSGATVGTEFYLQLSNDNAFKWPRFTKPYS